MMTELYNDRSNCARSAKLKLRKAGVEAPKPGVHFKVEKASEGGWTWIDLRAEPKAVEPEAKAVDRSEPVASVGDRVGIKGRKGSGVVVNMKLDSKSGEWMAVVHIGGKDVAVLRSRCAVIETVDDLAVKGVAAAAAGLAITEEALKAASKPTAADLKALRKAAAAAAAAEPVGEAPSASEAGPVSGAAAAAKDAAEPPGEPDGAGAEEGPVWADSVGGKFRWWANTAVGTVGPFATEAEALAAVGEEEEGPNFPPPSSYGLTPAVAAKLAAHGTARGLAKTAAKPVRETKLSETIKAVKAGVLPPKLEITSPQNQRWVKHCDALYALMVALDRDGLVAYAINGANTYAKRVRAWRDAAVAALDKRALHAV
jgi:hypothetical protein